MEGRDELKFLKMNPNVVRVKYGPMKNRSEQLLRELDEYKSTEKKWLLFMKSATDSFSLYDKDFNLLEINDTGLNMFPKGTTRKDIIGKNLSELVPDVRKDGKHYKAFSNVMKTGKSFSHDDFVPHSRFGKDTHINIKAFRVDKFLGIIITNITERKRALNIARQRKTELEKERKSLQETNIALKVLLKKRDEDKVELEEKVIFNINKLIAPILDRLKKTNLSKKQESYLRLLESHIHNIVNPSSYELSLKHLNLTPNEILVANLVKNGKTTKEIAEILNSSLRAIDFHRANLRKKLGILNKKINLRSHLISFD